MRMTTWPLVLLASVVLASPAGAQPRSGEAADEADVISPAVGLGANWTPQDPGWQIQLAVMGENRSRALLTQISLAYEVVGTQLHGETSPTGRVSQVVLNPFTVWAGYGGVRLGAGVDVSYGFLPVGPSGESATGWGVGGRVGGGLSLHPGPIGLWILGQYRFLSGTRVGGFFVDVLVGLH